MFKTLYDILLRDLRKIMRQKREVSKLKSKGYSLFVDNTVNVPKESVITFGAFLMQNGGLMSWLAHNPPRYFGACTLGQRLNGRADTK